ncbi:tyrosine-type recombinase/integrase [Actibacterium sp. 188UL27-1]|uniref:tyrosine-type recombinase/integrase n=1 Tax=Actibacterium sp. 188UL27-1 TaxID=2786961 RepID=UPI001957E4F9|nr:tyrosine-type recombinase/integrase [Actibacterium sp. 188UL27-1]MBM7070244.1 hypothetical protein [Actibacterium sp. 188UL27-1]
MHVDGICSVEWTDLDNAGRMLLIRDLKDPRNTVGNDQPIPISTATGFDAWAPVTAQGKHLGHTQKWIFPYSSRVARTAFRRTCVEAGVKDLHFHDLRHEGTRVQDQSAWTDSRSVPTT